MYAKEFLFYTILFCAVSSTGFHVSCESDAECHHLFTQKYQCSDNVCIHEPLWPFDMRKSLGAVLIVIISAFANAGGIGGGAIIVPLYIYIFYYTVGEAIPVSKATIFAGALVNIFVIINRRHPLNYNQLIIDFRVASLIVPLLLAGTMIGVLLTKVLPPILILVFMVAYLFHTTLKMFQRARELTIKERVMETVSQTRSQSNSEGTILRNKPTEMEESQLDQTTQNDTLDLSTIPDNSAPEFSIEIPDNKERISFWTAISKVKNSILICFTGYIIILITALLRGGKGFSSFIGIDSCSTGSWGLLLLAQFFSVLLATFVIRKAGNLLERTGNNLPLPEKQKILIKLGLNSHFAGVLAGSLGMGGGIIINPVLIGLGFEPEVAAAISGFVVLFTSSSTTTQFLIAGAFDFRNAFVILIFSAIGSFFGSFYVGKIIERYKRPSILLWILFGLILSSLLVLPIVGLLRVLDQPNIFEFNSPC